MGHSKSNLQFDNMKVLALFVALVIAVVSAEPEADAYYGYGGYGGYGYGGYGGYGYGGYRGKRSAEPYYGYGGYGGYGYGGYRGKRSADADAEATAVAEPEATA